MTNGKMVCKICEEPTSLFFIVVGNEMICTKCKDNKKDKVAQLHPPRLFTRYICDTHKVKTYNVSNMMVRHYMKDCVIRTQETLGIIYPKTEGGVNGDISRKYFLGVNEMDRLLINLENYVKTATIHKRLETSKKYNKKVSYHDRKFYYKHLRFYV